MIKRYAVSSTILVLMLALSTWSQSARGAEKAFDPTAAALKWIATMKVKPHDWPQWGGSPARNNTPEGKDIATEWDIDKGKNIKWAARLGSQTYGNPVIANGKVYVGSNNGSGYIKRYPSRVDLGVLLCFDEKTGEFLWQHSNEKLPTGRVHDWPLQGICAAPMVDGDRLWYVTSRGEVVCLDTDGFHDGENDGPFKTEKPKSDGKKEVEWDEKHEADVIWKLDMMADLSVSQHNMCSCSVTAAGDLLFVNSSNGVDEGHAVLPSPSAPSFMAIDKNNGKVLWTDNSPGSNVLHGQWSSPAYGELGGRAQVLFGGGDGWLYSFDPRGENGKAKLLWKFDCNPKESLYTLGGRATRNHLIGTPALYDGLVYIGVGEDPEHGEGVGHFWCIDPTKDGDVSPELVFNSKDPKKPIAHKRLQAADPKLGDFTKPNPNSAAIWHYEGADVTWDSVKPKVKKKWNKLTDAELDAIDGNTEKLVAKILEKHSDLKKDQVARDVNQVTARKFEESMHRTCGTAAIKNDLLFVADFSGLFHCLNAKTGKAYWTHDMLAASWASPLIVEDKVYIGDEDGDVTVFELADKMEIISEVSMGNSVYSTPVVANDVLYIANKDQLFAIKKGATSTPLKKRPGSSESEE